MACGEGYGSNLLAGSAARVVGVDANPEAHEHARLRYTRPNLRFERDLVESFAEPCDAVVFLQTIEHVADAGAILDHFRSMLRAGGVAYVSTPNLLTLAPPGAEKSDNPWHLREYRAEEFRALCEAHFARVELLGLFHARKLRAHELAIRLGWDSVHKRLGLTKRFYDRFTPAIAASDFALREGEPRRGAGLPRRLPCLSPRSATWRSSCTPTCPTSRASGPTPSGRSGCSTRSIRSYLPVLEVARDLTMTVTPVLADQLEDAGRAAAAARVPGRVADRRRRGRSARGAAPSAGRPAKRSWPATGGHWSCSTRPAAIRSQPFRGAAAEGRVALAASSATHAVLPLLATRAGLRLQLDAGIRSHRRRFGWDGGLWLPECAYSPGLEWRLAEHGVRWFCVDQSAHEAPLDALAPVETEAGPTALPIDWEAIGWLWSLDGYPSDPAHAQFAGKSLRGIRLWRVGGGAYDPAAAAAAARRQAGEFLAAASSRLRAFAARRGRRGLLVFAIDTELLGHWWSEGHLWLAAVLDRAAEAGVRTVTVPRALVEHEPLARPLAASTWGEGKDLRTWDSPPVEDLAWGARRLELRLLRALSQGLRGDPALRAARELLAAQASDWAFLDRRGQAGDYAFQRATDHAAAMLEAIDCGRVTDPRMRSLAPDLSLAPLLEP